MGGSTTMGDFHLARWFTGRRCGEQEFGQNGLRQAKTFGAGQLSSIEIERVKGISVLDSATA